MNYKKEINEYIIKALCNYDLAGLSISVNVEDNSPLDCKGLTYTAPAGYSDMPTRTPTSVNSIFHMASVSKLFTSTAILKLHETGELNIEDKLVDRLPYFEMDDSRKNDITIKDLLTHTAGMPDVESYHWTNPDISTNALEHFATSDYVKNGKLLWDVSENKFQYSNIAYELLGCIVEQVSGKTFDEFISDEILKPLSMNDSTFLTFRRTAFGKKLDADAATQEDALKALSLSELKKVNVVMPHKKDKENHIVKLDFFPYNRQHGPSSTLTCTHQDLLKFGKAHLNKFLLKEETYDLIWSSYTTVPNNGEGMGLGWFMREQDGHQIYGHEGSDDGFRSSFWICPELGVEIVVTSNMSKAPVKKINRHVFEILITN